MVGEGDLQVNVKWISKIDGKLLRIILSVHSEFKKMWVLYFVYFYCKFKDLFGSVSLLFPQLKVKPII